MSINSKKKMYLCCHISRSNSKTMIMTGYFVAMESILQLGPFSFRCSAGWIKIDGHTYCCLIYFKVDRVIYSTMSGLCFYDTLQMHEKWRRTILI